MIQPDDARLTAYVLGELDDADRAEIERELTQSAELRGEVEAIRQATAMLSGGLQAEPAPALTGEQRAAIEEHSSAQPVTLADGSDAIHKCSAWRRFVTPIAITLALAAIVFGLTQPAMFSARSGPRSTAKSNKEASSPQDEQSSQKLPSSNYLKDEGGFLSFEGSDDAAELSDSSGNALRQDGGRGAMGMSVESGAYPEYNESSRMARSTEGMMDGTAPAPAESDGPSVSIGLDQDGEPTAGFDFGFSRESFEADAPAPGGFAGGGMGGRAAGSASDMSRERRRNVELFGEDSDAAPAADPFGNPAEQSSSRMTRPGRLNLNTANDELGSELDTERGKLNEPVTRPLRSVQAGGEQSAERPQRPAPSTADVTAAPVVRRSAEKALGVDSPASEPAAEGEERAERLGDESEAIRESVAAVERRQPGKAGAGDESDEEFQRLAKQRAQATRTWRRAQATPNASRLVIGDRDELLLEGMQANVMVDGFRARVLLDLYYFNNRGRQLEGNFKLRLPNEASLYYFAFGQSAFEYRPQVDHLTAKGFLSSDLVRTSGLNPKGILEAREGSWNNVKEARIVPREKAAHAYSETVRRRVDPALVEWSGAGVFNARVFPLMPNKLHRIVVGYDVNLQQVGEDLVYQLDLPEDISQCMVDLNVSALPGTSVDIEPDTRPFTSGGRAYYHLNEVHDRHVELRFKTEGPAMLAGADPQAGEFFATRVRPELPVGEVEASRERAVFMVDTSLSSRPDKFNVWLDLLETSLKKNRDSMKQFAVLFFNIESHWWKQSFVDNNDENVDELLTFCRSLSLEGATDLRQALSEAVAPTWAKDDDKPRTHDLFLLSDGAVTWGEMNIHQLSKTLSQNEASLFAYKTGMTGTATGVLEHLARESGGAVFSVVNEQEVISAATAHRRRPWKLLNVTVPGGSDLLVAGRPEYIYTGQPLLIVGRGEPDDEVMLHVRRGDDEKHLSIKIDQRIGSELASRTYGQVAVGQLEDLGSSLEDVSVAYARHFRVTGQTCSLLMLDNEADYQRFNIKPEDDVFVVRSTPSADLITKKLDELAEQLADAKASVVAWLAKLENTAGFQFKVPTALRLVIDRLPQEAFDVQPQELACKFRKRGDTTKEFVQQLDSGKLNYVSVTEQATRRSEKHGAADGLRTLSSLIEQNPGDPVLTRDVAFSAIEWGLGGQAYPLLKRTASMRPYEPQSYQAMAQCLAEIGHADLAMIYYEVALNARWHERYKDVHQIAGVEYLRLLRRINSGQLSSHAPEYAKARIEALAGQTPIQTADLVITMMWNTDRTDVDLHIVEPTGEECFYDHPQTRIGGKITRDVTEGYGPEMYTLPNAKHGNYKILANYFGTDANRTNVRSKVYITVYEDFGGKRERISKKTITLSDQKEKRELTTVMIEK